MYKRLYEEEAGRQRSTVPQLTALVPGGSGAEESAEVAYRRVAEEGRAELKAFRADRGEQLKAVQQEVEAARADASRARMERARAEGEAKQAKDSVAGAGRRMEAEVCRIHGLGFRVQGSGFRSLWSGVLLQ